MCRLSWIRLPRPTPSVGRAPLTDAVERQDRGFVERAREKRAGRMALVVIGEDERRAQARADAVADERRQPRFLLEPDRHRHLEALEPGRREGQIGLEQALELADRLLVEHDVVEIGGRLTGALQTEADRVGGKVRVVLLAGEPFLLRRGDDLAVDDESTPRCRGRRPRCRGSRSCGAPVLTQRGRHGMDLTTYGPTRFAAHNGIRFHVSTNSRSLGFFGLWSGIVSP